MPQPKVTVLMTVYNGAKYLPSVISSILSQTYTDFELLIIDDYSTDNSREMIRSYDDKRIVLHCNQENMGQTKSLNVGLRLARGKYIARMDADDLALARWLEKQVAFIERHPEFSVVSANALGIDDADKIFRTFVVPSGSQDILLRSLLSSPINHVGSVFDREAILEVGGYDEKFKISADYDLWRRLLHKNCRITSVPETTVVLRRHTRSLSLSNSQTELQELSMIMRMNISFFSGNSFSTEDINSLCRVFYEPSALNDEQFEEGLSVLGVVYRAIGGKAGISKPSAAQWYKKSLKTAYLKRIFALIQQKKYDQVGKVSEGGIAVLGRGNVLSGIVTLLWINRQFLNLIPNVYNFLLFLKARYRMLVLQLSDKNGIKTC